MKYFVFLFFSCCLYLNAQIQLPNAGFEEWDTPGKNQEPLGWNSFTSASGSGLAYSLGRAKQVFECYDIRPGSSGKKSILIVSRSILGHIVNGTVTTGQLNLGSIRPQSPENYIITRSKNNAFHQLFHGLPDSIVFWTKFNSDDISNQAFMKLILHENRDVADTLKPEKSPLSPIIAQATTYINPTQKKWQRISIPLEYYNKQKKPAFLLLIFTTNEKPGGGSAVDSLLLDDIQFIYPHQYHYNFRN